MGLFFEHFGWWAFNGFPVDATNYFWWLFGDSGRGGCDLHRLACSSFAVNRRIAKRVGSQFILVRSLAVSLRVF